jgi:hypothetical protein
MFQNTNKKNEKIKLLTVVAFVGIGIFLLTQSTTNILILCGRTVYDYT